MLEVSGLKLPNGVMVSFKLEVGAIHSLTGANGSGKSLLLKSLALLTQTSWRRLSFHGASVESLSAQEWRKMILYVPPILLDTAGTVASYALLPLNFKIQQTNIPEASSWSKLKDLNLWERDINKISSGEKQLVQLIRALAYKPKLLLLDESFGQMDPARTALSEALLKDYVAQAGSALVVTHDALQALRLEGRSLSFSDLVEAT